MGTSATVSIHVEVTDEQVLWDHAKAVYAKENPGRDPADVEKEFLDMCGTREEPTVDQCLVMVFDPGESPPGVEIVESTADFDPPF